MREPSYRQILVSFMIVVHDLSSDDIMKRLAPTTIYCATKNSNGNARCPDVATESFGNTSNTLTHKKREDAHRIREPRDTGIRYQASNEEYGEGVLGFSKCYNHVKMEKMQSNINQTTHLNCKRSEKYSTNPAPLIRFRIVNPTIQNTTHI